MSSTIRDQILMCDECYNDFVYTVGQQLKAQSDDLPVEEPPKVCPACQVRRVRMTEWAAAQEKDVTPEPETPAPLFPELSEDGKFTGRLKWFNRRKGFGVIALDGGGEVFVHYSGIIGKGFKRLRAKRRVRFEIEESENRPQAVAVEVLPREEPTETVEHEPAPETEHPNNDAD